MSFCCLFSQSWPKRKQAAGVQHMRLLGKLLRPKHGLSDIYLTLSRHYHTLVIQRFWQNQHGDHQNIETESDKRPTHPGPFPVLTSVLFGSLIAKRRFWLFLFVAFFFFFNVILKRSRSDYSASHASIGRLCRTPPCARTREARLQGREPIIMIIKRSSRQFNIFGRSFTRCKKLPQHLCGPGSWSDVLAVSGGHCFGNGVRNLSPDCELFQTINRACCWH